ncbi:hypothetical protein BKA83DRAFT_4132705 [Pisolithus microcarpus]|nr:hypothetical protein BKA83DRAFT_4132705 [Pisolithus microcarpus]
MPMSSTLLLFLFCHSATFIVPSQEMDTCILPMYCIPIVIPLHHTPIIIHANVTGTINSVRVIMRCPHHREGTIIALFDMSIGIFHATKWATFYLFILSFVNVLTMLHKFNH